MSDAPSIRETIESAMEAQAAEPAPEPVEAVEAAPEPVEAPEAPPVEAKPAQPRQPDGKFARKDDKPAEPPAPKPEKAAPEVKAEAQPPAPEAKPAEPAAPPVKAPQSWKPQAREAFAKAPPEVQQEVARRESEIARALQETAEARRTADVVRQTLAPYEGVARANGMDSMQFAGTVLQNAAVLQMGTPQQKAQLVAGIISSYGIDVEAVNAVMQGQAPQAQAAPPQQDVGRLVEQALQQRVQAAQQQRAAAAWQDFQASAPEFLEDVKGDMQEILELAGRQGRNMTYQEAYDRACKVNDSVASVIAQRKSAEAARANAPTVQRAKVAASSIKATPGGSVTRPTGPQSLRETIEAAIAGQRT